MAQLTPLLVSLAALLSFGLSACGELPPNVVLITLDRAHSSKPDIHDSEALPTPNFDRFARSAVLYGHAYSTSSSTLSSHASLLTGLHPMQHGARARLASDSEISRSLFLPLSDRFTTLAEHLRDAGYDTAAFVSSPDLRRELGVAQGFEHYDGPPAASPASGSARRAELTADRAIRWMESRTGNPFLLAVNFVEPVVARPGVVRPGVVQPVVVRPGVVQPGVVQPVVVQPGVVRPGVVQPGVVQPVVVQPGASEASALDVLDIQLGRVLAALDASPHASETLIAVTSDRGPGSERRGGQAQFAQLYEEAVRVPLAVRYPGGSGAGTLIDTPTQNHRLFATFLEAAGATLPDVIKLQPLRGRDSLIFTEARPAAPRMQLDGDSSGDVRALYLFPFKLIQTSSGLSEFYDLDRDPKESRSIVSEAPKAYSRLLKLLIQYAAAHPPLYDDQRHTNVWPATVTALEALGTVE